MTDWLLSVVWYGSLVALALGLAGMLRPLVRLPPRVRRSAAAVFLATFAIGALIALAPRERTVAERSTALDRAVPSYQFREIHVRSVDATPDQVRRAVKEVTAGEISLFQLFTAIRRFGRNAPDGILNAPDDQPILDVAARSGFILLADTDREMTYGTVVAAPRGSRPSAEQLDAAWFDRLAGPGVAKAALNFVVEPDGVAHTRLTTETRVFATDRRTARAFTAYWRTIFPGSWILRITWLDAIARRAEKPAG
jgi:hypothetical protein